MCHKSETTVISVWGSWTVQGDVVARDLFSGWKTLYCLEFARGVNCTVTGSGEVGATRVSWESCLDVWNYTFNCIMCCVNTCNWLSVISAKTTVAGYLIV